MGHDSRNGGRGMSREPQIQARTAQHYAAIPMTVAMDSIAGAVDQAFPELFGWLAGHGISASGPPFIRYLVIDMAAELEIELAVPVGALVAGNGRVRPGVLPAGRYAVLRHTGSYDGLVASNAALNHWAREHGVKFDTWDTASGTAWRSRAEHYLTDPSTEPDPAKWEVDVAYLTSPA
jgi:effector-binding domain-containing protein